MARLGLGEEVARGLNPRLVYVSISGFGDKGPLAHKPAYDPIFQAASGLASVQGASDSARPRMVRCDAARQDCGAQCGASGLRPRSTRARRTGVGQHIRLSMLDAVLSFLWSGEMDGHTFLDNQVQGPEEFSPFDLIFETRGRLHLRGDRHQRPVGRVRQRHRQPAVAPGTPGSRLPRRAKPIARSGSRRCRRCCARDRPMNWIARLEGADVPCSAIHTRREVVHHPHLAASESLVVYRHPDAGDIRQARDPARFDRTPTSFASIPAMLGEHTAEVLSEAGYSGPGDCGAPVDEGHRLSPLAGPARR